MLSTTPYPIVKQTTQATQQPTAAVLHGLTLVLASFALCVATSLPVMAQQNTVETESTPTTELSPTKPTATEPTISAPDASRQHTDGNVENSHPDSKLEPKVERIHHEDSGSRIDELRIEGQTRSVEVQPKAVPLAPYQVDTRPENGSLIHQDSNRTGKTNRSWRLFRF